MTNLTDTDLDALDAEIALASGWIRKKRFKNQEYWWHSPKGTSIRRVLNPPRYTREEGIVDLWPLAVEMLSEWDLKICKPTKLLQGWRIMQNRKAQMGKMIVDEPQETLNIALALAVRDWITKEER